MLGGRVDILVNNAGLYPATATADLPDGDLDAMLAVNIRAPHVLAGAIAPAMAERGSGVIVNIGSWMAQVGSPYAAMYTATKAADEQLTRSWAAEVVIQPDDIAQAVLYLASDAAAMVHGITLYVDGGISATRPN